MGTTNYHLRWIMTGSHVSHVTGALSGSMFCACTTGSCVISALVGPFHQKWRQSRDGAEETLSWRHTFNFNNTRKLTIYTILHLELTSPHTHLELHTIIHHLHDSTSWVITRPPSPHTQPKLHTLIHHGHDSILLLLSIFKSSFVLCYICVL
jgi:hypothetical protein